MLATTHHTVTDQEWPDHIDHRMNLYEEHKHPTKVFVLCRAAFRLMIGLHPCRLMCVCSVCPFSAAVSLTPPPPPHVDAQLFFTSTRSPAVLYGVPQLHQAYSHLSCFFALPSLHSLQLKRRAACHTNQQVHHGLRGLEAGCCRCRFSLY